MEKTEKQEKTKGDNGMNERNLKRVATRSPEERRALASKAGKASGKRRRELKAARDIMREIMALPLSDNGDEKRLARFLTAGGMKESDLSKLAGVCAAQVRLALRGNTRAAEFVLKVTGDFPAEKAEIITEEKNRDEGKTVYAVDNSGRRFLRVYGRENVVFELPDNGRDAAKWRPIEKALKVAAMVDAAE